MITILFGVLLVPVLLVLPGAAVLRALFPRGLPGADSAERVFLAVTTSALLTGLLGFLLAEMGVFSVWLIAGLEIVVVLALWWWSAGQGGGLRPGLAGLAQFVGESLRPLGARLRRFRPEVVLLVVLLGIAMALFARPAEMLRGALDSGAYINAGVALGRTGSIIIRDPLMRQLNNDLPGGGSEVREVIQEFNPDRYTLKYLRMPAFYVLDKQAAAVIPQHYNYYHVWIALFYQLFGLWGALYATPFLALLAVTAIYFFTRRVFSSSVALLSLALIIVCPVEIWFARYPVSEVPTQWLAFVFFYAFACFMGGLDRLRSLDAATPDDVAGSDAGTEAMRVGRVVRLFGLVAGVALGSLALTRPDFPLYMAVVPLYLIVWRLTRTWRAEHWWFVAPLAALGGVWLVHYFFYSYPYTLDLYHNKLIDWRRDWQRFIPLAYGGVLLLLLLDRLHDRLTPVAAALGGWVMRRRLWGLAGLCLLVGAYLLWLYAVSPWLGSSRLFANEPNAGHIPFSWTSYIGAPVDPDLGVNLVRVGWYLSPLGVVLGGLGLLRALWKRLSGGSAAFFITLAVVSLIFAEETYTVPTYIYSLRRQLPVLIPALLIFAAYFLAWVGERWRPRLPARVGGWAAYGALLVFFLYTGRLIIGHVEEAGGLGQLEEFAGRFKNPAKTVLLFSNERDEPYVVATPLQMIWGFTCFSLTHPFGRDLHSDVVQGMIRRWQKQGYEVVAVLGANGGKLDMPDLALQPQARATWAWDVPELEQLRTQKPSNIARSVLPFGVYDIVSRTQTTAPGWPFTLDIGGLDYAQTVGGFFVQERDADGTAWRWTHNAALLRVPWQAGQAGHVTLRLRAGPLARSTPATVRLFIANNQGAPVGEALGTVTVPPGAPFTDYPFVVPAQPGPTALLRLESSTWSPVGDARALGVQVDVVGVGP